MKTKNIIYILFMLSTCFAGCDSFKDFSESDSGYGGSTSRFTIVNDYLYTVDTKFLKVFDITEPEKPQMVEKIEVGFAIETIFSFNNLLFVGSQSAMYIYDIAVPDKPVKLSQTTHFYSCDPVVADDKYAYVTLRTGTDCGGQVNQLQVLDITDPEDPDVVETVGLSRPYGLALTENMLFVCTSDRIIAYDKTNTPSLDVAYYINVEANDIIALDTILLIITDRAMFEYSYTDNSATYLSSMTLKSKEN